MAELTTTTELQKITTGLESFEQRKKSLIDLAESAKPVKIKSIDDKEGYKAASDKRKELKSARVLIEKEGKAMRDIITPVSKHISAKEKELVQIISTEEARLQAEEIWFEEEVAKLKAQKDAEEKERIQKRIDALAGYGFAVDYILVLGMTDEQFDEKLNSARLVFEAEQQRLAKEKEAEELAKKEEEERLKKVAEEQASIRAEQERIAKEQREAQDKINAQLKVIEDEKAKIEADKQAEINRIAREKEIEEAKKKAAEDALKEAEENRKRELEEKEKAESLAKEKEEKKLARMPDKKKLHEFALNIPAIGTLDLKTKEGKEIQAKSQELLDKVTTFIINSIESL